MTAFDRISARITPETRSHVSKTLDIVERIQAILEGKRMTQKDLASALGKSPSEISKWMSGLHNFELKTLVKIEEALGEAIFTVAPAGNTVSKMPLQPGSSVLSSKIAALPEDLAQRALDFVDFLAQKENALISQAKARKLYKSRPAPAGAVQEAPGGKYRKGK